jgi:hypothetical protein
MKRESLAVSEMLVKYAEAVAFLGDPLTPEDESAWREILITHFEGEKES